jgi:hypothetical protein
MVPNVYAGGGWTVAEEFLSASCAKGILEEIYNGVTPTAVLATVR